MKKLVIFLSSLLLSSYIFISCASNKELVKIENSKKGLYVGQYDENMTPDNSVVICIKMSKQDSGTVVFKQINPKYEAEELTFTYRDGESIIFKPCKPGAKYMVTKAAGNRMYDTGLGYTVYKWDFELKPNEQYYTVEAPQKPGVYCFYDDGLFNLAFFLDKRYSKIKDIDPDSDSVSLEQLLKLQADVSYKKENKGLTLVSKEDPGSAEADIKKSIEEYHIYYWSVWDSVKTEIKILNKANKKFSDYYSGTPWYDVYYQEYILNEKEYLDNKMQALDEYKKNNKVACCSLWD